MKTPIPILLVDDDEDDYFLTQDYLSEFKDHRYKLDWCSRYADALLHIEKQNYKLFLVDYRLGAKTGLELLQEARSMGCDAPIIMLTGKGDQAIDLKSMKAGASDYLVKSQITADLLERSIRYALERFENQRIILEQEQKYRGLFEQSIDAIGFADDKGNLLEGNPVFVSLLDFNEKDNRNLHLSQMFVNSIEGKNFWDELSTDGIIKGWEAELKCRRDEKRPFLISCTAIAPGEGEITGYQLMMHDIATLRQAEKELRMAEKLSLTGRMARMIAHEVRNPLTNINLALEELHESPVEADDRIFYHDIIKRNSKRINELITKLLESSKTTESALLPGNPIDTIEESLALCSDRLQLQKIELNLNLNSGKVLIGQDKEKLKIALLNILTNAIEALSNVTNPQISVAAESRSGIFEMSIADNGVGMDEETVNQIFEPFYTAKKSGMGLGMTSTKSILNSHNAKIQVESKPGSGTRFILRFPILR